MLREYSITDFGITAKVSAGLTQTQVGEMLGKPRSYVSECERGKRQIDPIEFVEFVLVYGKPTAWYLDYLLDVWGLTK